jgi:inner membrane protease subunit 2
LGRRCASGRPKFISQQLIIPGDESFRSDDSNLYGPIPAALIESKLTRILWPPERFGSLIEPSIPINHSGPAYRHAKDANERAKARRARVKIGRPYCVDANTY